MKSDEELKKDFKVFLDENGIINLVCLKMEEVKENNGHLTELIREEIFKIFDENPEKQYYLIADLIPAGNIQSAGFSPQTRKIGVQIVSHKQVKGGALLTSSLFAKAVIGFVLAVSGKQEHVRIFSTKEEALKWIKEEQNRF